MPKKRTLSVDEAAKHIGVTPQRISQLLQQKRIQGAKKKPGRPWRIPHPPEVIPSSLHPHWRIPHPPEVIPSSLHPHNPPPRGHLSAKQAGELLGLSSGRVRQLIRSGRIPGAKMQANDKWIVPQPFTVLPVKQDNRQKPAPSELSTKSI